MIQKCKSSRESRAIKSKHIFTFSVRSVIGRSLRNNGVCSSPATEHVAHEPRTNIYLASLAPQPIILSWSINSQGESDTRKASIFGCTNARNYSGCERTQIIETWRLPLEKIRVLAGRAKGQSIIHTWLGGFRSICGITRSARKSMMMESPQARLLETHYHTYNFKPWGSGRNHPRRGVVPMLVPRVKVASVLHSQHEMRIAKTIFYKSLNSVHRSKNRVCKCYDGCVANEETTS